MIANDVSNSKYVLKCLYVFPLLFYPRAANHFPAPQSLHPPTFVPLCVRPRRSWCLLP